jgi:hypothetical protein
LIDSSFHASPPSSPSVGMEGQITVFPCDRIAPCYRCLYPNPSVAEGCRSCANAGLPSFRSESNFLVGVLGPVPGLIGTLQAVETIKLITSRSLSKEQKGLTHPLPSSSSLTVRLPRAQASQSSLADRFTTMAVQESFTHSPFPQGGRLASAAVMEIAVTIQ